MIRALRRAAQQPPPGAGDADAVLAAEVAAKEASEVWLRPRLGSFDGYMGVSRKRAAGVQPQPRQVSRAICEMVPQFAHEQIIPSAEHYDHEYPSPEPIVEQMKELGLFGVTIPEEYGGTGLDLTTYVGLACLWDPGGSLP